MMHLFFAHGTGVRQSGYEQTLADIEKGLANAGRRDIAVSGVAWGERHGVKVTPGHIADMLPPEGAAKGATPTDPEVEAAIWAELMSDPVFELRVVAARVGVPSPQPPGQVQPSERFKTRLRSINIPDPAGGVTLEAVRNAAARLADGHYAPVVVDAVRSAGSAADPTLISATARAIVAIALIDARGQPGEGPDALFVLSARADLVAQVEGSLTEGVKGAVGDWFKSRIRGWALGRATGYGRDRRDGLMGSVSPGMGDILLTQRRGQDVLGMLRDAINALEGDVVVIGHSLGGEHLVNLISGPDRPSNISKLITVGSQISFFTACDAMADLRLGAPLPADFPPWLNVYDRNDFLSFCAERSFKGGQGVKDVEITSGMPFPDAHGAYWRQPRFYENLVEFIG